jgi:hypothetical protein
VRFYERPAGPKKDGGKRRVENNLSCRHRTGIRLTITSVVGAALVDSTGSVIGTASLGEGDLASSGAFEKLRQWTVLGTALALGTPKFLMIEREGSQTLSLTGGKIVLTDAPAFGPVNGLFPGGLCHRCVLHSQRTDPKSRACSCRPSLP